MCPARCFRKAFSAKQSGNTTYKVCNISKHRYSQQNGATYPSRVHFVVSACFFTFISDTIMSRFIISASKTVYTFQCSWLLTPLKIILYSLFSICTSLKSKASRNTSLLFDQQRRSDAGGIFGLETTALSFFKTVSPFWVHDIIDIRRRTRCVWWLVWSTFLDWIFDIFSTIAIPLPNGSIVVYWSKILLAVNDLKQIMSAKILLFFWMPMNSCKHVIHCVEMLNCDYLGGCEQNCCGTCSNVSK